MKPRLQEVTCPRCHGGTVSVNLATEEIPPHVCNPSDWTEDELALLLEKAEERRAIDDGPSDAQLGSYDDALAASLPSDAYTNAMLNAGRGHLL